MLQHAYLVAKLGVDTAENELGKDFKRVMCRGVSNVPLAVTCWCASVVPDRSLDSNPLHGFDLGTCLATRPASLRLRPFDANCEPTPKLDDFDDFA